MKQTPEKKDRRLRSAGWPLSRKLAVCMFALTICATAFTLAVFYSRSTRAAVRMNSTLSEENLLVARRNISKLLDNMDSSISAAFFRQGVKAALLQKNTIIQDPRYYYELNNAFSALTSSSATVNQILFYKPNGSHAAAVLQNVKARYAYDSYEKCLQHFTGDRGADEKALETYPMWFGCERSPIKTASQYCFVNVRLLHTNYSREPTALMLVFLEETSVREMYSFFGEDSFIMDAKGVIVSAGDKNMIGASVRNGPIYEKALASRQSTASFHYESRGRKVYASAVYLPELDCYLVAVPDVGALDTLRSSVLTAALVLFAAGTLFSLTAAVLVARSITRPITELKAAMERTRSGDLSVRFQGGGSEEVRYLGATFNIMLEDLDAYIREQRRAETQRQEGELKLLQSQINPHLLYNTLDSALYYISKKEIQRSGDVIRALSSFFKLSLSKGSDTVTVDTELRHIEQYIELQRLCRDKDVELEVEGDPALRQAEILRTTLQPIVENAFLHAFEGVVSEGHITVALALEQEGTMLRIDVTDDGIGMEEDELRALQQSLDASDSASGGFGLWNVNRRLRTRYGEDFGLCVDSELDMYTCVTIRVPYYRRDDAADYGKKPGG